jgi:dihydroorotate dehydrogenase
MVDLSTTITDGLTLRDPFMIASSHWTANERVFRILATVSPSAVTLKTTSERKGGDGEAFAKRDMRRLQNRFGDPFATYTDGPPTLELWDIATTYKMTSIARSILKDSILGLSVLQGEDYKAIRDSLDLNNYGYVELNWKYTFRDISADGIQEIADDVSKFLQIFGSLPRIVKLSREAARFMDAPEFQRILSILSEAKTSLIVANSKRTRVPPSRVSDSHPTELFKGVVVGEHLFLETYDLLRSISQMKSYETIIPPLIASGGILDIAGIVDAIAAGASATQLCTILDLRGVQVVDLLREQLGVLCREVGAFTEFALMIRSASERWNEKVLEARSLDLYGDRVINQVLGDRGLIEPLIQTALTEECGGLPRQVAEQPKITLSRQLRFIITRGNVSSYLLSQYCARNLGFQMLAMEDAAQFRKALIRPDFEYDFLILPRSVLTYINKQGEDRFGGKQPIEVAPVANSIMQLVGDKTTNLEDLQRIYHFSGVTSRNSLIQVLKLVKPDTFELSSSDLLPLFRFWSPTSAILAKPPLSQIYPLLGPKELQEKWGIFWRGSEDLLLVASKDLLESDQGDVIAQAVLFEIERVRETIIQDLNRAALECINGGFLVSFAKYLGGKATIL